MSRHRRVLIDLWVALAICLAAAVFGPTAQGATPATEHILIGMATDTTYTITRLDDGQTLTTDSDAIGIAHYALPAGTDPAPDTITIAAKNERLQNNGCDIRRKNP